MAGQEFVYEVNHIQAIRKGLSPVHVADVFRKELNVDILENAIGVPHSDTFQFSFCIGDYTGCFYTISIRLTRKWIVCKKYFGTLLECPKLGNASCIFA